MKIHKELIAPTEACNSDSTAKMSSVALTFVAFSAVIFMSTSLAWLAEPGFKERCTNRPIQKTKFFLVFRDEFQRRVLCAHLSCSCLLCGIPLRVLPEGGLRNTTMSASPPPPSPPKKPAPKLVMRGMYPPGGPKIVRQEFERLGFQWVPPSTPFGPFVASVFVFNVIKGGNRLVGF